MNPIDPLADTERPAPLLDHESAPSRLFVDDEPCEIDAEYDAGGRTISMVDSDPIAAAMLDAVRSRMPRGSR